MTKLVPGIPPHLFFFDPLAPPDVLTLCGFCIHISSTYHLAKLYQPHTTSLRRHWNVG